MLTVTCKRNLPLKVEEEKQGIISILGSNSRGPKPPAAASFRRTLSADMSSKKWLADNGFNKPPALKRIFSSAQLSIISAVNYQSSSSDDEEEELDGKKFHQNPKQDLWSSIVSQKKTEELPPPYVHHLVKKSSSSLCSKSLEICTEGLGSETGSDKVTLDTGSNEVTLETSSDKVEELLHQAQQEKETPKISYSEEIPKVAKYNYPAASNKKLQPKSFPPPIPLLAGSTEGPAVHMQSLRQNGRLVLKAVSSPSTKKLQAHREDGRLRLALIQPPKSQQHVQQPNSNKAVLFDEKEYIIKENLENVFNIQAANAIQGHDDEIIKDIEEGTDEIQDTVTKQELPEMSREVVNIHRSALMMKKIMGMENQNPIWSHKFTHAAAKIETENEGKETSPHSLPPRPPTTRTIPATPPAASSFNAYEYFWRIKPAVSGIKNPITQYSTIKHNISNNMPAPEKPKSYGQQELLALKTCRKARRSLLSWDAYCIATT
ncbi:protein FAF-like, chloroplastic [Apium graveolens]|uniref:protein FAF-like, chloroplastic n=1 Tax=Apium graveolens TaxID=4045 RepID=UPI003D795AEC